MARATTAIGRGGVTFIRVTGLVRQAWPEELRTTFSITLMVLVTVDFLTIE